MLDQCSIQLVLSVSDSIVLGAAPSEFVHKPEVDPEKATLFEG